MTDSLTRIAFDAPHNRQELLWGQPQRAGEYRILNVPVWAFGVSVGTLVRAQRVAGDEARYIDVIEPSPGATVRVMVPEGTVASELYLHRIGPDAAAIGVGVGPASFFDPLIVAVHIRDRSQWWPVFGAYLNGLQAEGAIAGWEVADPDEFPDEADPGEHSMDAASASRLLHDQPSTSRDGYWVLRSRRDSV